MSYIPRADENPIVKVEKLDDPSVSSDNFFDESNTYREFEQDLEEYDEFTTERNRFAMSPAARVSVL